MKKIYSLIASAIVAVGFTACTQSDLLEGSTSDASLTSADNAIQFDTYMGKTGVTRAGAEGSITTTSLQTGSHKDAGFGVFAYYTGAKTYNQAQYKDGGSAVADENKLVPNFMYNQQVKYISSDWKYSPIKYWPNEVQNGAVDNQSIPAKSDGTNGGKVSFFAYAPYVESGSGSYGITAITGADTKGDPKITYTLDNTHFVDLLWGTYNGTTAGVANQTNSGVTGISDASGGTYEEALIKDQKTNADLTKQAVNGKVGFLFKHALAKIGGREDDDDSPTHGFLVKLDIDDGSNVTGGSREQFTVSATNDAWRTIVTIKDIKVTNDLDGDGTEDTGEGDQFLATGGTLNLATGVWTTGSTGPFTQTIGTTTTSPAVTPNAELNQKIAEYYSNSGTQATWISKYSTLYTDYFKTGLTTVNSGEHPGVTETAQSVYNSTSQVPFVLIPGQSPKYFVTVDYVVRTYDAALNSKYTEVNQKITKLIAFPTIEMNKFYTIIMHLGLTGVKFTATVSDWEKTYDDDGDSSTPEIDANFDVHVPLNVATVTP